MRILFTNNTLAYRSGSELYVRDLAIALQRRGHQPIAYSPQLGDIADDLRAATIPVTDDLRTIRLEPDVIHGQHHLETMAALVRFPSVPAVFVCHGWAPWQEAPPRHPRVGCYVAVDDLVRDRLVVESGIDPESVQLLYNFVDLRRFPRRDALPTRPRRALIFNSHATEENLGGVIREACERASIELDLNGYASGRVVTDPGKMLRDYDLVFARARSALEAMASGCAVIVADPLGMAGMVSSSNVDALKRRNFGLSTLTLPLTVAEVERQITSYDVADAGRVSDLVRREADLEPLVSRYEELYTKAVRRKSPPDERDERNAFVTYLRWLSVQTKIPGLYGWSELKRSHEVLSLSVDSLRAGLRRLQRNSMGRSPERAAIPTPAESKIEGTERELQLTLSELSEAERRHRSELASVRDRVMRMRTGGRWGAVARWLKQKR